MSFDDFQKKQRINKQKAVLRDYFQKHEGYVLCLSDDQAFITLVSMTIKDLAIQGRYAAVIPDTVKAFKVITESFEAGKKPVLLVERVMNTVGDTSFLIRQYKDSFPELRVMVMTTTADKDRIMLLHEAGADGFILKPLSSADLLEKMADILRPPSPVRQLLDKARSFVSKNFGAEAMQLTKKVLEIKPDSAAGYVVLGDSLRISGNAEKAKLAYERACKYSGDYLEPLQRLADLAKESGDKAVQLEYLKRMDAISPLNAQRKVEIGELLVALGNTESATQIFDTAVSRAYRDAMDHVAAMAQKIAVSLQDSDPAQAEKYLRQCLDLKGKDLTIDDLATFNQLGISLRKQGRWQDAVTEYKRALGIAPRAEGLFYNMGMAYAEGSDFDSAIKCMQKALAINPKLPMSSAALAYNIGMVFSKSFTKDKAIQCLQIALTLDAAHEAARNMLERLKKEQEAE